MYSEMYIHSSNSDAVKDMYIAGQSNPKYSQDQNSCLYTQLDGWSSLSIGCRVTLLVFLQKPFTNPAGHVHLLYILVWHSVRSAALPPAFSIVRMSERDDPRIPSESLWYLNCPCPHGGGGNKVDFKADI